MNKTDDRMLDLLFHHQAHWNAIAEELGLCFGGVDTPITDPYGNAAMVIKAIREMKGEK